MTSHELIGLASSQVNRINEFTCWQTHVLTSRQANDPLRNLTYHNATGILHNEDACLFLSHKIACRVSFAVHCLLFYPTSTHNTCPETRTSPLTHAASCCRRGVPFKVVWLPMANTNMRSTPANTCSPRSTRAHTRVPFLCITFKSTAPCEFTEVTCAAPSNSKRHSSDNATTCPSTQSTMLPSRQRIWRVKPVKSENVLSVT